jgi:prohibitin 2
MTMTEAQPAARRPSIGTRVRTWMKRNAISLYALALTVLLGLLAIAPSMVVTVPAGHVGVLWMRFFGGTRTNYVLGEGLHLILPWNVVNFYDARLRSDTRSYEAVSANGLSITVEVSLRYRINPPAAGFVHKLAGPDYAETLVRPKMASLVYEFVSQGNPESFYSKNRADIQSFLLRRAREEFPAVSHQITSMPLKADAKPDRLDVTMIRVEEVLVSGITLPPLVRQAIERKVEQQQIMEEYDFRIRREAKERDRKRIEADGIRDFQEIVAHSITPEYLRLRGVEATRAFANSTNAKTIIIGGRDGLPVILNTGDDAKQSLPPEPASTTGSHHPLPSDHLNHVPHDETIDDDKAP